MNELKDFIKEGFINVLKNRKCAEAYGIKPPSMLFYGPAGCGKIFFAEKIAEELGIFGQQKGVKCFYFLTGDDEEPFVSALFPQFADIEEGEEALTLAVCNKMSREIKLTKVYIDRTLKSVSANCEFFYTDEESLKVNVGHILRILGMIRNTYYVNWVIWNNLSE